MHISFFLIDNILFKRRRQFYFMGACLIITKNDSLPLPNVEKTEIDQKNIQIEILDELQKPSKITEEQTKKEQQKQNQVREMKLSNHKPEESNNNRYSLRGLQNSKTMRKNNVEFAEKLLQKTYSSKRRRIVNEESFKTFAKKASSNFVKSNEESEYSSQNSEVIKVEENNIDQIRVETPFNRILHTQQNMIGKGMTDRDNQLIDLSMTENEPIKTHDLRLQNKSVYSGYCLQGKKNGFGTIYWQDGSRYEGMWCDNKSEGKGKLYYANHQTYQGDWHQNKAHGNGIFTYTDGSKYDGQWVNNVKEGSGLQIWQNGENYIGMWSQGKKNGYGQLFFKDGSYYKGQFSGNQIHGFGTYYWKGQKTYKGEWQNNTMSGKGYLTWEQTGQSYDGMFEHNKMNGLGVYYYKNGNSASGLWKNDRKNGTFQQRDSAGKTKIVVWFMGKRLKYPEERSKKMFQNVKDSLNQKTESISHIL